VRSSTVFDDCANWDSAHRRALSTINAVCNRLRRQRVTPSDAIREKWNEEIAIYVHVVATAADRWLLHHSSGRASGTARTPGRSRCVGPGPRSRPG